MTLNAKSFRYSFQVRWLISKSNFRAMHRAHAVCDVVDLKSAKNYIATYQKFIYIDMIDKNEWFYMYIEP